MNRREQNPPEQKRLRLLQAIIRLAAFLLFAESFSVCLSALGAAARSLSQPQSVLLPGPALILLAALCTTAVFGRYFCGFLCGFGTAQELFSAAGARAGFSRRIPPRAERILTKLKYAVLAVFLLCAFRGTEMLSPWSAFGTLTAVVRGQAEPQALLTPAFGALLFLLAASLFCRRAFCRYLCPLGAVFGILSRFSLDTRAQRCTAGESCAVCPHPCPRYGVSYAGMAITTVLFACAALYASGVLPGTAAAPPAPSENAGSYTDGVFTSIGRGFRGPVSAAVTVEGGSIVSVEIGENREDAVYLNSAAALIPQIIAAQSTDIDAVTGATYSSRGLLNAVSDALAAEEEVPAPSGENVSSPAYTLSSVPDGTYEGSAIGFRGELCVSVTVEGGAITAVRILSYYDTEEYLFHAAPAVIEGIVSGTPADYDAVTGATYSANGLLEAIADALGLEPSVLPLYDAAPLENKGKPSHHVTQKFIESDEQYRELAEKYRTLMYGPDGKRITD